MACDFTVCNDGGKGGSLEELFLGENDALARSVFAAANVTFTLLTAAWDWRGYCSSGSHVHKVSATVFVSRVMIVPIQIQKDRFSAFSQYAISVSVLCCESF